MTNELIFFIIAFLDLAFVLVASRFGRAGLYTAIILNLLMVSVFGAKLNERFGYLSNSGNIFYACVFFATQLLAQIYGKNEAQKSVLLGFVTIIFFILTSQFVVLTVGDSQSRPVNQAIETLFSAAPRIAAASLFAFLASQLVNINLFSYLSQKSFGKSLFLRVNLTNLIGQAVDSAIFFTVAFYGIIPLSSLKEILLAGYVTKVAVGVFSTLFFYLAADSKPSEE